MKTPLQQIFDKLLFDNLVESQVDFAKKISYTEGYVSEALDKQTISPKMQKRLNELFGISKEWMQSEGKEGDMIPGKSKPNEVRAIPHEDFMEVTYLPAKAQGGYVAGFADSTNPDLMQFPTMLVSKEYEKGNYLVVEVVGDSMDDDTAKSIANKDKILVKEIERGSWVFTLPFKKYLFVIVTKDGVVFKQIISHDLEKRTIVCHSFNPLPEFKDYELSLDNEVLQLFYVKKIVEKPIRF